MKFQGSYQEWKATVKCGHIDSTQPYVSIAYRRRISGDASTNYEVGRYFHRAAYGEIKQP